MNPKRRQYLYAMMGQNDHPKDDRHRRCLVFLDAARRRVDMESPDGVRQCGATATHVEIAPDGLSWFCCAGHLDPSRYRSVTLEEFWESIDGPAAARILGAP